MKKWPKHPDKEGEAALVEIYALKWSIIQTKKGYYQLRCGCPGKHQTYMHLTPSNPNHFQEKVRYCRRECERYDAENPG